MELVCLGIEVGLAWPGLTPNFAVLELLNYAVEAKLIVWGYQRILADCVQRPQQLQGGLVPGD